jgi:hypothetical protein
MPLRNCGADGAAAAPCLLRHLVVFPSSTARRDTAVLLDKVGQTEAAIDYATGAMVNAQVRRIRALPSHPPCLPCLACPRAQLRCGVEAGRRPRPRIRNSSGKQT